MTAEESGAMRWEALHAEVCGDCDDTVIEECPSKLWQAVEQELLLISALEAERGMLRRTIERVLELLESHKTNVYLPLKARVEELEAHECEHEHCGDAGGEPDTEER